MQDVKIAELKRIVDTSPVGDFKPFSHQLIEQLDKNKSTANQ